VAPDKVVVVVDERARWFGFRFVVRNLLLPPPGAAGVAVGQFLLQLAD